MIRRLKYAIKISNLDLIEGMVKKPGKSRKANKQAKIYFPDPELLLCYAHRLSMNYIIAMLLVVS